MELIDFFRLLYLRNAGFLIVIRQNAQTLAPGVVAIMDAEHGYREWRVAEELEPGYVHSPNATTITRDALLQWIHTPNRLIIGPALKRAWDTLQLVAPKYTHELFEHVELWMQHAQPSTYFSQQLYHVWELVQQWLWQFVPYPHTAERTMTAVMQLWSYKLRALAYEQPLRMYPHVQTRSDAVHLQSRWLRSESVLRWLDENVLQQPWYTRVPAYVDGSLYSFQIPNLTAEQRAVCSGAYGTPMRPRFNSQVPQLSLFFAGSLEAVVQMWLAHFPGSGFVKTIDANRVVYRLALTDQRFIECCVYCKR